MLRKILAAAAALSLCAALGAQTKVHVCDSDGSGLVIPNEIYGHFSEHLGNCIYGGIWVGEDSEIPNVDGYRKDVLEALKALEVPVLRWPGGCFADDYHWMDGIGPREKRARISNNNWGGTMEDNSFGTHEFLNFCELIGAEPYISGNVGSGTAEELAKWVEYMTSDSRSTVADMRRANGRDKPWSVKYLGIGNEAWGCGGNMRPEYYSDLFRRYVTYTRNYNRDHGLYKIASGASDFDYNWTEVCMREIGGRMDAIALHYYTVLEWGSKGAATHFTDKEYYRTLGRAFGIDDCIRRHIAIMDKYDPRGVIDLFVDEWGTWWDVEPGTNPGHLFQQNSMRDAIVAASTFNIFHKYIRRLKMCNIAQIVNVLQSMVLTRGDQMVLTPTYYVFDMYKVHKNARSIPVEYDEGELCYNDKGRVPELSVTASRKDGVLNVTFVNPALDKDRRIVLDWDSAGSSSFAGATIISSGNIADYNDFGKEPAVCTKVFKGVKTHPKNIEFTLPAHSIVNIAIK